MVTRTLKALSKATLVSALALSASAATSETLSDALVMAYRNSHLLEQNRALLRATDENVAIAVAAIRPIIAFVAQGEGVQPSTPSTYNNNLTGSLALSTTLTLYDFGRTRAAINSAKETVLATRAALVSVEEQVLLQAVSAYYTVQQSVQTVALQQNNVNVLQQELKATQDRFDVGEVTKTDVAQAQAALAAAQASYVAAQGNLAVARESYKAATGSYPGVLRATGGQPATARSLAEAQAIAVRLHPSVQQAQHQVAAANFNLRRAEASTRPSIDAGMKNGVDNKGNTGSSLTVTFTQPIYSGGQISATYRQAAANSDAAKAQLLQTGVTVVQNVGNAWAQLAVSRASISANQEQVRAAQVAFDGVREEAKLGSRTTLDVLTAEQTLLNAKVALVTADTNQGIAVYSLLSAMGLLTADHLKLGVPSYDPAAYFNAVSNGPASGLSPQGAALDRIMRGIGKK